MQNKILGTLGFFLVLLLVTNASAVACSSPANCGSSDVDVYEVTVSYKVEITDWDCEAMYEWRCADGESGSCSDSSNSCTGSCGSSLCDDHGGEFEIVGDYGSTRNGHQGCCHSSQYSDSDPSSLPTGYWCTDHSEPSETEYRQEDRWSCYKIVSVNSWTSCVNHRQYATDVNWQYTQGYTSPPPCNNIPLDQFCNSAPTQPNVQVTPGSPDTVEALTCTVTAPSTDPDMPVPLDSILYTFRWYQNGNLRNSFTTTSGPYLTGHGAGVVTPSLLLPGPTRSGDNWTCIATPTDPWVPGPPGQDFVVIRPPDNGECDGTDGDGDGLIDEGMHSCANNDLFSINGRTYCFDCRSAATKVDLDGNCNDFNAYLSILGDQEDIDDILDIRQYYREVIPYDTGEGLYVLDDCNALVSKLGDDRYTVDGAVFDNLICNELDLYFDADGGSLGSPHLGKITDGNGPYFGAVCEFTEICDGEDNDNDGDIDEGYNSCQNGETFSSGNSSYCLDCRPVSTPAQAQTNCLSHGGSWDLSNITDNELKANVQAIIANYAPSRTVYGNAPKGMYVQDTCNEVETTYLGVVGTDSDIFGYDGYPPAGDLICNNNCITFTGWTDNILGHDAEGKLEDVPCSGVLPYRQGALCEWPSGGPNEGICNDGIDNDGDLLVDCLDPDCCNDTVNCPTYVSNEGANNRVCCSNTLDDDSDTFVDWADAQCTTVEICSNGIDDDGDLLVDCNDDDCCTDDINCPQYAVNEGTNNYLCCANSFDDDGDGDVDAADSQCPNIENDCSDGIDNDGDGLIDCLDDDCCVDPVCPYDNNVNSEGLNNRVCCSNTLDDDTDTFVDAADSDCPPPEICSDGIDNDGDLLVDCLDDDCCNDALNCPLYATNEGANNYLCCSNTLDDDGDGDVDAADSQCPNIENDCSDGIDNDGDGLIDCLDDDCCVDPVCPYDNNVNSEGLNNRVCCSNTLDDDTDTFVDAADSDCPPPEICSDGIDNDGDLLVDCLDDDCCNDVNCPLYTVNEGANNRVCCSNVIDDDTDGAIDWADSQCTVPETCNNLIDDDGDGLIDCNDPDCCTDAACPQYAVNEGATSPGGTQYLCCTNTLDDDDDGDIDVADTQCPNIELDCGDGLDNDGDGLIDCLDDDCCTDNANCPIYLINEGANNGVCCSNTLDDDSDLDTDWADSQCVLENCNNGIDDDGDTLVDCLDPDCCNDVACPMYNSNEGANGRICCANSIDDDTDTFTDGADLQCIDDPNVDTCTTAPPDGYPVCAFNCPGTQTCEPNFLNTNCECVGGGDENGNCNDGVLDVDETCEAGVDESACNAAAGEQCIDCECQIPGGGYNGEFNAPWHVITEKYTFPVEYNDTSNNVPEPIKWDMGMASIGGDCLEIQATLVDYLLLPMYGNDHVGEIIMIALMGSSCSGTAQAIAPNGKVVTGLYMIDTRELPKLCPTCEIPEIPVVIHTLGGYTTGRNDAITAYNSAKAVVNTLTTECIDGDCSPQIEVFWDDARIHLSAAERYLQSCPSGGELCRLSQYYSIRARELAVQGLSLR